MCLAAIRWQPGERFPLVVASNRDEFFARAALPLSWWRPPGGGSAVLAGRDALGSGTWLGLTRAGRMALLTNVREPQRSRAQAPTRGQVVLDWLAGDGSADDFAAWQNARGLHGFNAIVADFARGELAWVSNRIAAPRRLGPGLFGLSNAALDTPWPKLIRLKQALAEAVRAPASADEVVAELLVALQDRRTAAEADLPDTGIGLARERLLSAPWIAIAGSDGLVDYGTRCSTLVVVERLGRRLQARVIEQTYDRRGGVAGRVGVDLPDWPMPPGRSLPAPATDGALPGHG